MISSRIETFGGQTVLFTPERWADDAHVAEYEKQCNLLVVPEISDDPYVAERAALAQRIVQNVEFQWLFQLTIHLHDGLSIEEITDPLQLRNRIYREQERDPNEFAVVRTAPQ